MSDDIFEQLLNYEEKVNKLVETLPSIEEFKNFVFELEEIRKLVIKYRETYVEDVELTEIFNKIIKITE